MFCPTSHGGDLQFGTNVLGHFYVTQLVVLILVSSAKPSSDGHVRIGDVSSEGHIGAPNVKDCGPVSYETLVKAREEVRWEP